MALELFKKLDGLLQFVSSRVGSVDAHTTAGIDYYIESSIVQFIIGMQPLNTHNVY